MKHELKIYPDYFEDVVGRKKDFEIRRLDRDYKVGDTLVLNEWDGKQYTGRSVERKIKYIYREDKDAAFAFLSPGYGVLGLEPAKEDIEIIARGEAAV